MKLRMFSNSLPLACAITALLGPTLAQADTFTFIVPDAFTTGDDNWSTDAKWNAVPVSDPTTSLIFTLQATGNSQTQTTGAINDIATANPNSAFQLNTMTFNSNPSAGNGSLVVALNISGNPLDFVSDGATTPVVNLSGNRTAGQPVVFNVSNNVALAAGTVFTGNGTATYNFSGQLSGSAFTKSGTSTLTLSGANTYSGNTTLSAGGLVLGNNSAINSGSLLVTGDSSIGIASGVDISNVIDRGTSTVTYFYAGTAAGTATYSGALTGSGTINIGNSGSGNNTTILDFTNAGGFTGNVVGAAGNALGADYFRFSNIGDAGNFTVNKGGNRGGVIYSGTSAIGFDTRQIVLGTALSTGNNNVGGYTTTLSGLNGNGIPVNSFANNATDPAHTVTFNTEMAMTTFAGNTIFYFDGSNTGDNTFAGDIGDPTGTQTLGIGKWGSGKWILSGDNSFEGDLVVANGTLSASTIDNAGINQPIGKGALIILGHANTNGTLAYTGSANASTDKQIVLGNIRNNNQAGAGGIANNGDGTLTFSNATFNSIAGNTLTTRVRTLTLGGSNTGANTISGEIQNSAAGAAVNLTKTGDGTWKLSGDNTYTGTTSVNQGTLALVGGSQASPITVASGASLGFTLGSPTTSTSSVNFTNGAVKITGTPDNVSEYVLMTASGGITGVPVLDPPVPGYAIDVQDSGTKLVLAKAIPTTTLVIDLGEGTVIEGNTTGTYGASNLPLPPLPSGSILRSVSVDLVFEATDNDNFASDFAVLFDPTPATPGEDFSVIMTNGLIKFGAPVQLSWPAAADAGPVTPLADTKPASAWAAAGVIDLATTGIFLGNAFGGPVTGGTWSGTVTLTYDLVGAGTPYENWAGGALFDGDANGDGVSNGLAFLLGANDPNVSALGLLPAVTETSGGLILTFSSRNAASRGAATLNVEHSSDLGISDAWAAAAVPETSGGPVNGVTFTVTPGSPLNSVVATISSSEAVAGKLFGRLKAVNP